MGAYGTPTWKGVTKGGEDCVLGCQRNKKQGTWELMKQVSLLMGVASKCILEEYIYYRQTEMEEIKRNRKRREYAEHIQGSLTNTF